MFGISCETTSTPRPRSEARRIESRTIWVWRAPRAAVGSSIRSTLVAHFIARAIATACRWPPERSLTLTPESRTLIPRNPSASDASLAICRFASTPNHPRSPVRGELVTEEDVLRHAQVRREREVLIDGLDSKAVRVAYRKEPDRLRRARRARLRRRTRRRS